jgi:hypothetical protein
MINYLNTLLMIFWLFLPFSSKAQKNYRLTQQDSFVIKTIVSPDVRILLFKNEQIYVTNSNIGIDVYDIKGNKLRHVRFRKKEKSLAIQVSSVIPYLTGFVFNWGGHISVFDSSGSLRLKTHVWSKKHYKDHKINGLRVELIGAEIAEPNTLIWKDTLIMPIRPLVYKNKPTSKSSKTEKYEWLINFLTNRATDTLEVSPAFPLFHTYKISFAYALDSQRMPIQDTKGRKVERLGTIGKTDSIWSETIKQGAFYPESQNSIWTFDSIRKQIIYGNSVFPQMKIYDLSGNLLKIFGERGKHLTSTDTPYKMDKQALIDSLQKCNIDLMPKFIHNYALTKIARSLFYDKIFHDPLTNRTYRTYTRPLPYSEKEIYIMVSSSDDVIRQKFDSLLQNRPHFLQIYDHNNHDRLIYDEAVPAPFHILEVKGDTLWAVAGVSDKGLKIVKYVVRKE